MHGILNISGLSHYFHCLDPGPHFTAAGPRADAGPSAPAGPGGTGEAPRGVSASSCGLLAGRHDPAHERCWDQCGHRAAAESRRCLSHAAPHVPPHITPLLTALSGADRPFLAAMAISPLGSVTVC